MILKIPIFLYMPQIQSPKQKQNIIKTAVVSYSGLFQLRLHFHTTAVHQPVHAVHTAQLHLHLLGLSKVHRTANQATRQQQKQQLHGKQVLDQKIIQCQLQ